MDPSTLASKRQGLHLAVRMLMGKGALQHAVRVLGCVELLALGAGLTREQACRALVVLASLPPRLRLDFAHILGVSDCSDADDGGLAGRARAATKDDGDRPSNGEASSADGSGGAREDAARWDGWRDGGGEHGARSEETVPSRPARETELGDSTLTTSPTVSTDPTASALPGPDEDTHGSEPLPRLISQEESGSSERRDETVGGAGAAEDSSTPDVRLAHRDDDRRSEGTDDAHSQRDAERSTATESSPLTAPPPSASVDETHPAPGSSSSSPSSSPLASLSPSPARPTPPSDVFQSQRLRGINTIALVALIVGSWLLAIRAIVGDTLPE